MLKRLAAILLLMMMATAAFAQGKQNQTNERTVNGVVTNSGGAPVKGAVVQIENTKTLQIRSFITKDDGGYFFNGLSTDVDYQLSAEFNGERSGTKTLSSFDSRREARINLQIKAH